MRSVIDDSYFAVLEKGGAAPDAHGEDEAVVADAVGR